MKNIQFFWFSLFLFFSSNLFAQESVVTETVNGFSFDMIYVKGGTFHMGAQCADKSLQNYDSNANADEQPVHSVFVSDFYIGRYEVTQKLWVALMGNNPSIITIGDNYPVNKVSWLDAVEFVKKLSSVTGKKYRLPTEVEWEYAARGGVKSHNTIYSGSNDYNDVAWVKSNTIPIGERYPCHEVGLLRPNELGLYDMSGNAFEWCIDSYYNDMYVTPEKKRVPHRGKVFRGGAVVADETASRVSSRSSYSDDSWAWFISFRLVLEK